MGIRSSFWKVNGGKGESYSRIYNRDGRMSLEDDKVQRIWKDYFEDLYNIGTQEEGSVYIWFCWCPER